MKKLFEEQSVLVVPGSAFQIPNHIRVVFCAPEKKIEEAFLRIKEFCDKYEK